MKKNTHPILSMTVSRIALGLLSLLIVTLVIFLSVNLLPGSYASASLGQNATPEAVAALEAKLGLNRPWPIRYVEWLGNAATGDLGTSFSGRPVMALIGPRLENTLVLAAITAAIAVPLAIGLGILCARYRGRMLDRFLSTSTLAAISVPEFLVAYVVMICLLYTSPSPRDRTRSRMPSSA